jgi:hypothetical protein
LALREEMLEQIMTPEQPGNDVVKRFDLVHYQQDKLVEVCRQ